MPSVSVPYESKKVMTLNAVKIRRYIWIEIKYRLYYNDK